MDELLQDWRNRVYAAQSAYYETAEKLHRQNYWLGIPVIIVSSVVGTAIFADWSKNGTLKWIVGSVSIAAAILASLQTFLKFGENATLHGNAADWFAAIRRDIDQLLALPSELRGHPKHTLDNLRQEINKAGQKSPELSEKLWRRTARRFGVNEPPPSPSGRAPARARARPPRPRQRPSRRRPGSGPASAARPPDPRRRASLPRPRDKPESAVTYVDPSTGRLYPLDEPRWRADSGHHLNLAPGPGLGRGDIDTSRRSVWRYAGAIVGVEHAVTMGEGWTPLMAGHWAGAPVSTSSSS